MWSETLTKHKPCTKWSSVLASVTTGRRKGFIGHQRVPTGGGVFGQKECAGDWSQNLDNAAIWKPVRAPLLWSEKSEYFNAKPFQFSLTVRDPCDLDPETETEPCPWAILYLSPSQTAIPPDYIKHSKEPHSCSQVWFLQPTVLPRELLCFQVRRNDKEMGPEKQKCFSPKTVSTCFRGDKNN